MNAHERIRHAIIQAPVNQAEIAKKLGVSRPTITQWKNGDTKNLRMENLFALADVTGFSARWLATGEGPERKEDAENPYLRLNPIEQVIIRKSESLPPELKSQVLDFLDFLSAKVDVNAKL